MSQYKIGDKVLVEAEFVGGHDNGAVLKIFGYDFNGFTSVFAGNQFIRPYTPRQEFEYGEEVEVSDGVSGKWVRAMFCGKSCNQNTICPYYVNLILGGGLSTGCYEYQFCRKLTTKKETITIGTTTYDKSEFENAVRDLKPVEGK